ncbi:MAG TPA: hypothetical protein VE395_03115 [Acidimicrobiales bacterium]|jgi:hypothetical protein|nr:hypothetical protein [Acidimicrobiales bacterium]
MRARLLPLLLLPAAGLVACGDDADPLDLVTAAGAETVDDGNARMSSTTEVTAGGTTVTVASEGLVDFEGKRAALTTELPGGRGEFEVVADRTTLYLRGPNLAALGVSTPWASVDLGRVDDLTGTDLEDLRSSGDEASSGLGLLSGAEEVEEVGEEELDGTETTRYRATVDLRRAVEEAGAVSDRAAFEAFVEQLGDEDIDVDVWLDGEDRVRRLRYEQPVPDQEGATATVTLDFTDFGVDEQVEVPPAAEATDITDRVLQEAQAATA